MADSDPIGDKQKVIRGGVFLTLSPVSSLILGLFITILIGEYILPKDYAIFEWFNVLASFFATIIPFQLPSAIGRYVATSKGANDEVALENLTRTSTALTLILVPISGITAFFITPLVFSAVGIGSAYSIVDTLIFCVGIMGLNLSNFAVGIASGHLEFEKVGLSQFLGNVISQGLLIILIPLGWGIQALILKWVVLGFITTISLTISLPKIWSLRGSLYSMKPLIDFAYPSIISFIFGYFFNELLIRSIFQTYFSQSELGLYGFAVRLTTFINAIMLGFQNAILPHYAKVFGQSGSQALESELKWTLRLSFFLFLPLIVGSVVIAPAAFLIIFPNYYWSYQYFSILMMQLFFYLFLRPYNAALGAMAKTKQILVSSVIAAVTSGFFMILFVNYSLILVVVAYMSNSFLSAFVSALYVRKEARINLNVKTTIPVSIISFSTIIPAALIHFIRLNPFIELVCIFVIFVSVYAISIRSFRLVTAKEIEKAIIFLPGKVAVPLTRALVRVFCKNDTDALNKST
jgi:O-antigen/teichoic acid export membrane protein